MKENTTVATSYTSLYKFLSVLDENQIYKLHKVVSGRLNVAAFSDDEIQRLESRLSIQAVGKVIPMNSN